FDDDRFEGVETVVLTLQEPSGSPGWTVGSQRTAVITIRDDDPAPLVQDDCGCGGSLVSSHAGLHGGAPGSFSAGSPVRYGDGVTRVAGSDLSSSGFGVPWGVSRSWSNAPGLAAGSSGGSGQVVGEMPYLLRAGDGTIAAVTSCTGCLFFADVGGN